MDAVVRNFACFEYITTYLDRINIIPKVSIYTMVVECRVTLWYLHEHNTRLLEGLTNLSRDKTAAISQTIFPDAILWVISFLFWLGFHRSLSLCDPKNWIPANMQSNFNVCVSSSVWSIVNIYSSYLFSVTSDCLGMIRVWSNCVSKKLHTVCALLCLATSRADAHHLGLPWAVWAVDWFNKSHKASDKYPKIHHFATEICIHVHTSATIWCIAG